MGLYCQLRLWSSQFLVQLLVRGQWRVTSSGLGLGPLCCGVKHMGFGTRNWPAFTTYWLCQIIIGSLLITIGSWALSKKNQSWTVLKAEKKQILSRTIAIGEKRPQCRTGLNSKYSMDKWEVIAKKRWGAGGQWMENWREESSGLRGDSGYTDLTGVLAWR